MIYQCKFGFIVQLSVRMWRSKLDLSVQIWSHLSVVSFSLQFQHFIKQRSDENKENHITSPLRVEKYRDKWGGFIF